MKKGRVNYYKKKTPKCKTLTLQQIYGIQDNKKTEDERKKDWCGDKAQQEFLEKIGRI